MCSARSILSSFSLIFSSSPDWLELLGVSESSLFLKQSRQYTGFLLVGLNGRVHCLTHLSHVASNDSRSELPSPLKRDLPVPESRSREPPRLNCRSLLNLPPDRGSLLPNSPMIHENSSCLINLWYSCMY